MRSETSPERDGSVGMLPQPESMLAGHVVLRCSDTATLHAYITGMVGKHERSAGPDPCNIELRQASLGRVDVGVLHTDIMMTQQAEFANSAAFLIQFPLSGHIALDVDGREFAVQVGAGAVISPASRVRRVATPGWTLALQVDGAFVRSRLAARVGRLRARPLVFHPLLTTSAAEIRGYCLLIVEAIDRGVASRGCPVAAVLEAGLVDLLLDVQPHSHGSAVADTELATRSDRIGAVTDHLRAHLNEPLTVGRLAKIAGCSVRSLQATFMDLCGMSPKEFVQRHRLARARELLEVRDPATPIYQIAYETGFSQLGRFAARYRAMYGESPSETRTRAATHPGRSEPA